ncbi:MAG: ATP-binding protein, partial [Oscillospiraceae bacterium]|nr:ATP-binding protein [Oscillospiraceae bacterium]
MGEWKVIEPAVNSCAEFYEIASDFGDPLELFREAISNAYDWGATYISLSIAMERINGRDAMVLELLDDGSGMDRNTLEQNFWALGNSASKTDSEKIGEKGHGTKIYLNSEKVYVRTTKDGHTYESVCDHPLADLSKGQLHSPKTREIDNQYPNGTLIRIEGYNGNETMLFRHEVIKDYIYWFTKLGSFEKEVHPEHTRDFCVKLRG